MAPMLRVGLTGGIACGKSRVLSRLANLGVAGVDLDAVAHDVMAPGGSAYDPVVGAFGRGIVAPDGTIDRKALGDVVFADVGARRRLEALVHPRIRDDETARAARLRSRGEPLLVSDAALMVEAGRHLRYDRVVVVHCPTEMQKARLQARDGLSDREAQARLDAQMPVEEKRRFAHMEVDTSGSLEETDRQADELAAVLRLEAAERRRSSTVPFTRALGGVVGAGRAGPRGLSPRVFLQIVAEEEDVALQVLASRLVPPASSAWYRAAREGEGEAWPEALAVPLALWALAHDRDDEWLLGAASSLARLTHGEGEDVAAAAFAALAAFGVARSGRLDVVMDGLEEWGHRAVRWGRAAPAGRVREAVRSVFRHPGDVAAARSDGGGFVGGLVGLIAGATAEDLAKGDVEVVRGAL